MEPTAKRHCLRTTHNCAVCLDHQRTGFQCPNHACTTWICLKCYTTDLETASSPSCCFCSITIPRKLWSSLFSPAFIQEHVNPLWSRFLLAEEAKRMPIYQALALIERDARDLDQIAGAYLNDIVMPLRTKLAEVRTSLRNAEHTLRLHLHNADRRRQGGLDLPRTVVQSKRCGKSACPGVLNELFYCSLCDTTTCNQCDTVHGSQPCNPDILKSIACIKTESKPCPVCAVNIERDYGCDQMYCTMPGCATFFSWNTGLLMRPVHKHNPHFLDLQRSAQPPLTPTLHIRGCHQFEMAHDRKWEHLGSFLLTSLRNAHTAACNIELAIQDADPRHGEKKREQLAVKSLLASSADGKPYTETAYARDIRQSMKDDQVRSELDDAMRVFLSASIQLFEAYLIDGRAQHLLDQCHAIALTLNAAIFQTSARYGNLKPKHLMVVDNRKLVYLCWARVSDAANDPRASRIDRHIIEE